jgi:hypothetical protein
MDTLSIRLDLNYFLNYSYRSHLDLQQFKGHDIAEKRMDLTSNAKTQHFEPNLKFQNFFKLKV